MVVGGSVLRKMRLFSVGVGCLSAFVQCVVSVYSTFSLKSPRLRGTKASNTNRRLFLYKGPNLPPSPDQHLW